ncbi:GOLPH3/VPS74 family protein [Actinomadura kijaniata]|uniref:GOLPH3/VPS74 family protein n=1 Tax=Actinomadura kijaniata TaxID=46161 RepID=UPI003F1CAC82
MALTLAEEFLLLALRDDTGKPMVDGTRLKAALAGAAIVELALDGALRLTGPDEPHHKPGRLAATGGPVTHERFAGLVELVDGRKPKDAVSRAAGFNSWRGDRGRDLRDALLADLAEAGALREEQGRVLGLFPSRAWKPADPGVEAEILERVRAAVVAGTDPDPRTAALVALVHAVGLLPKLFPEADRKELRRRGKEISERDWGGEAVRKAIQEIQGAVLIAVTAASSAVAASG